MFKQTVETLKSLLFRLLKLAKNPLVDFERQLLEKEDKLLSGRDALVRALASLRILDDNLRDVKIEIRSIENNLRIDSEGSEARVNATKLLSLRERRDLFESSQSSGTEAVKIAEEQLKDLIVNIEDHKSKLETYKLKVEINGSRKQIKDTLLKSNFSNVEADLKKEVTIQEYSFNEETKLDDRLGLNKPSNNYKVDDILNEFRVK
jgi:hypothetical protein